jgi:hypothetical protein
MRQFNVRLRDHERAKIVALARSLGVSNGDAVRLLLQNMAAMPAPMAKAAHELDAKPDAEPDVKEVQHDR